MVPDLLIRDLAPATHKELKRRAREAGMSLQSYVTKVLERSAATTPLVTWLEDLDELPRHSSISGAEAVRGARDELW